VTEQIASSGVHSVFAK